MCFVLSEQILLNLSSTFSNRNTAFSRCCARQTNFDSHFWDLRISQIDGRTAEQPPVSKPSLPTVAQSPFAEEKKRKNIIC